MPTTWRARPTTYRGIPMRSRLEARFAALLDDAGAQWQYEPNAFGGRAGQYLPDFLIHALFDAEPLPFPIYIEVKPTLEKAYEAMRRMPIIWESDEGARLLVVVREPPLVFWANADSRIFRIQATMDWLVP